MREPWASPSQKTATEHEIYLVFFLNIHKAKL